MPLLSCLLNSSQLSKAIIMLIIHWLLQLGRDTQYGIKWMITGSTLLTVVETIQIITNQQTNYWRYEWQRAISWRNSKLSLPLPLFISYTNTNQFTFQKLDTSKQTRGTPRWLLIKLWPFIDGSTTYKNPRTLV